MGDRDLKQLADIVYEEVADLKPGRLHALLQRPAAVRIAIAGAIRTLEALGDAETEVGVEVEPAPRLSPDEARRTLATLREPRRNPEVFTAADLAKVLNISRQTVHTWRREGRVLGWSGEKRGLLFPKAQLSKDKKLPPDLARVLPFFPDHQAAWDWLTEPTPALNGRRPLTCLHASKLDEVMAAARGRSQGDFT